MPGGNEQRSTGSEAARAYSARTSEITEAKLVRAEVLARLAISLARTEGPSLGERTSQAPDTDLTQLLTPQEQMKLPTAEMMLQTIERGYNG